MSSQRHEREFYCFDVSDETAGQHNEKFSNPIGGISECQAPAPPAPSVPPYDILQEAYTPAILDEPFGAQYVQGISFTTSVNGRILGIKRYSTATSGISAIGLYTINGPSTSGTGTGTELAVKAVTDAGAGWNLYTLDTPISIVAGNYYAAAVLMAGTTSNKTDQFFDPDSYTNGNLTAPASVIDGTGYGNGLLKLSSVMVFPNEWATNPAGAGRAGWNGIDVWFQET